MVWSIFGLLAKQQDYILQHCVSAACTLAPACARSAAATPPPAPEPTITTSQSMTKSQSLPCACCTQLHSQSLFQIAIPQTGHVCVQPGVLPCHVVIPRWRIVPRCKWHITVISNLRRFCLCLREMLLCLSNVLNHIPVWSMKAASLKVECRIWQAPYNPC